MTDVFLSYSHEDAEAAKRIEKALRDLGVEVWIDHRLQAGESFTARIQRHIDSADAVVVCWSKRAVESTWVQSEALYALDRGKLVPVLVGKCELRPPFNVVHSSHLTGWGGESDHAGWQGLLLALERCVDGVRLADPDLVKKHGISEAQVVMPEAARRRKAVRRAIVAGVAVPALLATAAVGYVLINTAQTRDEISGTVAQAEAARKADEVVRRADAERESELRSWEASRAIGTRAAIEDFLQVYPKSEHVPAANDLLVEIGKRELTQMNAAQAAAAETQAWLKATGAATIDSYENFKSVFPRSQRVHLANEAIARLSTAARDQQDRAAWSAAQSENTERAYQQYLKLAEQGTIAGQYSADARLSIGDIVGQKQRRQQDADRAAQQAADRRDQEAWDRALGYNSMSGFSQYIDATGGKGRFVSEATSRMAALEREDDLIAAARSKDSAAAYGRYLQDYPRGRYSSEAQSRFQALDRTEREDTAAFEKAKRVNTRAALNDYLQRYGRVLHRQEAQELLDEFDGADRAAWNAAMRSDTVGAYERYLDQYMPRGGRYVSDAQYRISRLQYVASNQPVTPMPSGGSSYAPGTQSRTMLPSNSGAEGRQDPGATYAPMSREPQMTPSYAPPSGQSRQATPQAPPARRDLQEPPDDIPTGIRPRQLQAAPAGAARTDEEKDTGYQ